MRRRSLRADHHEPEGSNDGAQMGAHLTGPRTRPAGRKQKEQTMASDNDALAWAPSKGRLAPLKARGAFKPEPPTGMSQLLLKRLLVMAGRYTGEGKLRQAMDLYWVLAEDHRGSAEADAAKARLLDMAEAYERHDATHMTRSIYERLLHAEG